jgi:diadenosine tetraphosphate (Ap4A) HIT family hydrolase
MFALDPAFPPTSQALGDLRLCHVRLQADARFPWLVLIPRVAGAVELEDLTAEDRDFLMDEILRCGAAVRGLGEALGHRVEKLNVGQLGNITRQLHIHVVGRRSEDAAWPGPVWGFGAATPYSAAELATAIAMAQASLGL